MSNHVSGYHPITSQWQYSSTRIRIALISATQRAAPQTTHTNTIPASHTPVRPTPLNRTATSPPVVPQSTLLVSDKLQILPALPPCTTSMASLTSAAVTIPHFSGLKAGQTTVRAPTVSMVAVPKATGLTVKASLKDAGVATVAIAASAILASSALAAEVKLGGDDGSLAFIPSELTINAGEELVFYNNAGFPHNVVFDEDEVPAGVNASSISMNEEDLLNAPGETYKVTLKEKGTYSFYCSPHQGAGMVGKVTVN